MKDLPILFRGPMIRALLADRKTQTRRLPKLSAAARAAGVKPENAPCPYKVGQLRWVKETFGYPENNKENGIVYRATDPTWDQASTKDCKTMLWKQSIFMSRVESRITLEITGVRVERLQDISEADANAEGCCTERCHVCGPEEWPEIESPKHHYKHLWDSINKKIHPWASNPWVFAISFKVL